MTKLVQARGPIERTRVLIWVRAEVQDNGDGTWSGRLSSHGDAVTANSLEKVLSLLSERHSVKDFSN